MALSLYHQKYQAQSDAKLQDKIDEKSAELLAIFKQVSFHPAYEPVKVAILGCGDRRFVPAHRKLFAHYTEKTVDITTFDITIEHLLGETQFIQHDCTLPLPNQPYDITYAHVVLKFIPREKQWDLIKTSYDALRSGGIAIHVLDTEEIGATDERLSSGLYAVPFETLKERLKGEGITFVEVPLLYGIGLILLK